MVEVVSSNLDIRRLTDADVTRWDEFVDGNPAATFFHLSAWRSILEAEFGCADYYLYAERHGEIVGVLPLCQVRNFLAGNVLLSTPFLVYGGPVGTDAAVCSALSDKASAIARELHVDYLELRNQKPLGGTHWRSQTRYTTFRKCLSANIEDNLAAIPRKQRAMVRKGIKAGIEVSWDPDVEVFYQVFSESYRNLGTPVFAKSLFVRLIDTFGDKCWVTTLRKDGEVLASVVSFAFKDQILPYYGGGGIAARRFGANDLMYWTVMERAANDGFGWFDFGRSKVDTGSYHFKKHWGFEPSPLSYQYELIGASDLPNLSPTNPRFQLPIEVWKRLPISLSRVIGPSIARRLV